MKFSQIIFAGTVFIITLLPFENVQAKELNQEGFNQYVVELKEEALAQGFEQTLIETSFAKVKFHQRAVSADRKQPEKVETLEILRQLSKSSKALGELKGIAQTIPNQAMLINAVVLQEAKDSSEIENIITTQDELYKALATKTKPSPQVKEVINYKKAIFLGHELLKKQGFLRLKDIKT